MSHSSVRTCLFGDILCALCSWLLISEMWFLFGIGFLMTRKFLILKTRKLKLSEIAEIRRQDRQSEVVEAQACSEWADVFFLAARRSSGLSGRWSALGRAELGPSSGPALSLRPTALPLGGACALIEPQPGRFKVVALPGCVISGLRSLRATYLKSGERKKDSQTTMRV